MNNIDYDGTHGENVVNDSDHSDKIINSDLVGKNSDGMFLHLYYHSFLYFMCFVVILFLNFQNRKGSSF